MLTQAQLVALFELLSGPDLLPALPPTEASLARIDAELGVRLPQSLIAFARACPVYGRWFCSLGEDYAESHHIITANRCWHDSRLPPWAVLINHGHDGDCDCLDLRQYDPSSGEYPVFYLSRDPWQDDEDDSEEEARLLAPTVSEYLERLVLNRAQRHFDNVNRSGSLRRGSRELVPRIEAILAGELPEPDA